MKRLDYPDLVDLMKGRDTTRKWDVMVSYDEDKLNSLLRADSTKLKDVLTIPPFKREIQDNWGRSEEVLFIMSLANPNLQFLSGDHNRVALKCQMTGHYESVGKTPKVEMPFPEGTSLELHVSLLNCAGQRVPDEKGVRFLLDTENGIPQGYPKDYTITLDPGNGRGNGLCLVFHDTTATITSENVIVGFGARKGIENHFHNDGKALYYYLTGVSRYTPDAKNRVLEPVAFNFGISCGEKNQHGVLTTWISVKGGAGGGERPSGQEPLTFKPDDKTTQWPIPNGSSASIIISSYAMVELFFKPNLVDAFENLTQVKSDEGIAFKGALKSGNIHVDGFAKTTKPGDTSPNLLNLKFTEHDRYGVKTEAQQPTFWEEWLMGGSGELPDFYRNLSAPRPNIDLTMHALDYFLTTNVFLPGQHIFKAHSPVADASKSKGLAFPRDLILTGDVATE
ncbi:hypothetical protein BDW42DRAFT_192863 [Aspergillus taichungensis]|uniref:Uncharacterized protein n=1 Tax=Aspergillus taichungensis TaxID=482145 RepID=A0A2J5HYU9_9EURO|nr:hypothetical protein BDW42DRAFT_192863 [Aspergillus taichungensis]